MRGVQPLAHSPHVAYGALESSPQGSPWVSKFGGGGAVMVNTTIPP